MSKRTDAQSNSKPVESKDNNMAQWYSNKKCPECGKFTSQPMMIQNGLGEVTSCTGICKKHGIVNIDWEFL